MRTAPTILILIALILTSLPSPAWAQADLRARLDAMNAALIEPGAETVAPIEDDSNNLARVFEALDDLASGRAGRRKVRIALYGDSNHVNDHAAASLRRSLGEVFGYGGHGFVAPARPWLWYQHTEIAIRQSHQHWDAFAVTTPPHRIPIYGHGGIVGRCSDPRGAVEYSSADLGVPDNQTFDRVELSFACLPDGGLLRVLVDGQPARSIDTRCETPRFKAEAIDVSPGRHVVRVEVERGRAALLGAVFENNQPGVVVDGLGVGALSLRFMEMMDERFFIDSMRQRDYDLVILHTGSNMWAPRLHPGFMARVIPRIRAALGPDVSILVLSPPDFTRERSGPEVGHKRMSDCRDEKRALAHAHKLAFWDFYAEMGGRGSIIEWSRRGMVKADMVHFKPPFFDLLNKRLARALLAQMARNLATPSTSQTEGVIKPQ